MMNNEKIIYNETAKKNKNTIRKNPRIHYEDFDVIFVPKHPNLAFVGDPHVLEDYRLSADPRMKNGVHTGKWDLCFTDADGNKRRYHNFVMSPKKGKVIDHIGGNTFDLRIELLRELTQAENMQSRENVDEGEVIRHECGKYFVRFPKMPEASYPLFDTHEEASAHLYKIQDERLDNYSRRKSLEIRAKHETYLFHPVFYRAFGDEETIAEIESLPYVEDDKGNKQYIINTASWQLKVLNAEYLKLYEAERNRLKSLLVSADEEERIELNRILDWLADGRYVLNLWYFTMEFEKIVCRYLADKKQ